MGCSEGLADAALLADAHTMVLGIVTARHGNQPADAHLLIDGYLADAADRDIPAEVAWAMLFSAGVLWVDALMECRATHHDMSYIEAVQELSLMVAGRDHE